MPCHPLRRSAMYRTCLCLGQSALPIKTSLVSNLCLVLGQRSLRRLGRSSRGAQKVGVEQTGESNATEATTDGEPPPQHVWDHDQEDTPPSADSVQRSKPRTPTPGSVSSEFITEYKRIGRARTIRGQEDEQSMMEREPSRTEREPSRTEREWTPYCMEREKGSPWKWEKLWEEQFPKPGSVSSEFIREYKLVAKNSSKDEQSQMDREPSWMDRDEPSRMDRAPTRMDRAPTRMDREPSRMDREPSRMDRAPSRRMNQEFSSNSPLEKPPKIKGEVIYGTNVVQLAIQSHRRVILKVYTKREDILQLCEEYGIPTETISSIAMNSLSNQSIHQGVCADVLPMTLQNVRGGEASPSESEDSAGSLRILPPPSSLRSSIFKLPT
ncbi:unnamed protein product [Cyprideis torosa]|uniref:Uncharacterized protein n=1 Tax=Cyprideis torosa TaxID=163714 RepID=A0A7R8W748_9CRUS|nr:unnamed protein product [Cyprideis torosa]CAG0887176.1 unnamed protein product [Cyprideis torosa]